MLLSQDNGLAPLKYHAYRVKDVGVDTRVSERVTLFHVNPSDFLVESLAGTALERPIEAVDGSNSHCRYFRSAAPPSRLSRFFNRVAEGVSAF